MLTQEQINNITKWFYLKSGYQFRDPQFLIQALTRKSALGIHVPKEAIIFEGLEFVGDRILNAVLAVDLFNRNPNATPGELHAPYVALSKNNNNEKILGGSLYRVAKEWRLEYFLIKSEDEDLTKHGLRGKPKNYPKNKSQEGILADHVEALIGAMFLDSGEDYHQIKNIIISFWEHLGLNSDNESDSDFGESVIDEPYSFVNDKSSKIEEKFLKVSKLKNWPQARDFLEIGADVDVVDIDGRSALHHFSTHGNLIAVESLITEFKADINKSDKKNITPLSDAVNNNKVEIAKLLILHGANIDANLLSVAIRNSCTELVMFFLNNDIVKYFTIEDLQNAANTATAIKKSNPKQNDFTKMLNRAIALKDGGLQKDSSQKTSAVLNHSVLYTLPVDISETNQVIYYNTLCS